MPLDLTDAELATAATACRAMACQEGERAKKLENPRSAGRLRLIPSGSPPLLRSSRRLASDQVELQRRIPRSARC
jgi:hypothetical protein